jgi:hypothetical protein
MPLSQNLVQQQQQHLQLHHELLYTTPIPSLFTVKCCSFKGTVAGSLLHCCLTPGPGYRRWWGWAKAGGAGWKWQEALARERRTRQWRRGGCVRRVVALGACGGWRLEERASGCGSSKRRREKGTSMLSLKHWRLLVPPPFYNIYGICTKT